MRVQSGSTTLLSSPGYASNYEESFPLPNEINGVTEEHSGTDSYPTNSTEDYTEIIKTAQHNQFRQENTATSTGSDTTNADLKITMLKNQGEIQFVLAGSRTNLKKITQTKGNTRLQLPNGKLLKVVKYVPQTQVVLNKPTPECNNQCAEINNVHTENPPKASLKKKYSLTLKGGDKPLSNKASKKWITKDEKERQKEYKFRYLASFREIQEDKKWAATSKAKILGENSTYDEREMEIAEKALEVHIYCESYWKLLCT